MADNIAWPLVVTSKIAASSSLVGRLIASGSQDLVIGAWWTSVFPGLALFVFVLGCNLLGDGIQRLIDPQAW